MTPLRTLIARVITRENIFALGLCLVVVGLLIITTDSAPTWIYQGF